MPIRSKNLQQQDLPLQGEHDPFGPVTCIPDSIHSRPTEFLTSPPHVSTDMHSSRLPCGDFCSQDYKTCHVPVSQKVMSSMQGSNDSLSPPLLDSVHLLPCEAEDEECLKVHETLDGSCTSFHIGDPIMQEHYGTFKTIPPVGTIGSHQAEDLQVQNSTEDLVNPDVTQEDMETCNDSSNKLRAEPMDSDENAKEHTPKSCSGFQPPACSSSAFSLMMADSEHNPSTSGYSSEQPAKAKTQKELMKILKELRSYLPPEKQLMGKSSTMASLRYALHCMQQVKANEEYYQQLLLTNDEHPYGHDLSYYTVEEIANITSEFTKNNMDVFAAAVSLESGRILYISEQASTVLRSSADLFSQVRFVELLAPQDVSVFYSSTTPYRLPSWSMSNGSDSGHLDGLEEKSFYCRISCGQESRKELSYHPFRLTPYLIRVQTEGAVEQLCCVLFAERVHSGYEAPRIPADKRIFTTTHTPNCLFQNVDERAVPLLGYLPQDLIGTPIILHLHPSDRPLMLAVHKKILQYGGQPFDFSPMRFCARNGEYVTIDTSWSSFINPWSRKVSFIIGRHKVRMGPGNEDVFTAPMSSGDRSLQPDIQELTEQIHQLLLQPVHNSGSSGYGSLGSNGSHENPMSGASSSDSNGNLNEDIKEKHGTHQGHRSKDLNSSSQEMRGHQSSKGSPEPGTGHTGNGCSKDVNSESSGIAAGPPQSEQLPAKQPPYSYQQINSLDSVIRYLESCSVLVSDKREIMSSGKTSSASDNLLQMREDDRCLSGMVHKLPSLPQNRFQSPQTIRGPGSTISPISAVPSTSHRHQPVVLSATIPGTSQSVPGSLPHPSLASLPVSSAAIPQLSIAKAESVVSLTSHGSYSSTIVHVGDKKRQPEAELEDGQSHSEILPILPGNTEKEPYKQLGLTKEVLVAHTQKEESNFLSVFMDVKKLSAFQTRCNTYMHEKPVALRSHAPQGGDPAGRKSGKMRKSKVKRVRPESWDSSSSGVPQAHRCPLQGLNTTAWSQSDTSHASCPPLPYPVLPAYSLPVFPSPQIPLPNDNGIPMPNVTSSNMQPFPAPLLTPMVALMLPNYMYPPNLPPNVYPGAAPSHPFPIPPPFYTPQATFPSSTPTFPVPQPVLTPTQHGFPVPQPVQPFSYPVPPRFQKMKEGISRSSTPRDPPSPPLFQSRCSSPLQLNLLQLEESQKADQSEGGAGVGGAGNCSFMPQPCEDPNLPISLAGYPNNEHTSDAVSTGSDLMDILLQDDACSGTCSGSSAVSESLTSGSNGNGTSGSQAGSSQTCHSSKYFASVDSSENNQKAKGSTTSGRRESVLKYVLQDPMWLLMANADEKVMMTYQIPQREIDMVLKHDRNRLKSMQKLQPRFTEEQKKELGEIHPWIQRGGLPCAVEVAGCIFCKDRSSDGDDCTDSLQDLELSRIMESCE